MTHLVLCLMKNISQLEIAQLEIELMLRAIRVAEFKEKGSCF
jgi:hypothetical protein